MTQKTKPPINKILHQLFLKSKNRRIEITLLEDIKTGQKGFIVATKRLIDFRTRKITTTSSVYSPETFIFLSDTMHFFLDNSEIKHKILLKELADLPEATAETTLK